MQQAQQATHAQPDSTQTPTTTTTTCQGENPHVLERLLHGASTMAAKYKSLKPFVLSLR